MRRLFISLATASIVFAALAAPVAGANRDTSPVLRFADASVVEGAWSSLVRTPAGVSMTLHTTEIPEGSVTTVWWIVFNHPENCSHGEGPFRCGEGDLLAFGGDGSAGDSVLRAAGHVVGGNGVANWAGALRIGDTSEALWGPGLTNPSGADVHLVVHSHGPKIPGLAANMIHSFGGGCANVPPGTGTPGPNLCWDPQFSVHET